jgi:tripartite-type tricarboxylate transporter receptor subunit TctC
MRSSAGIRTSARLATLRGVAAAVLVRAALLPAILSPTAGAWAQTPEAFYKGRQITFLVGAGAGGGYDAYYRSFARYLVHHIPGAPIIVNKNMPAASGLAAANTLYTSADRDGATIGAFPNNIPMDTLFGNPGARFDAQKLNWLGSIGKLENVCATWITSPIKTIAQAREREVIVAAAAATSNSAIMPKVLNALLGTRFKIVSGYDPGSGMTLALESGETEGVCGLSWSTMKAARPHWIKDHKLNVIVQMGLTKLPELPDVPSALELVSDSMKHQVLELILMRQEIGRPVAAPPGVPADRLELLRRAFDETMRDPEFLAEAEKLQLEIEPLSAREIDALLAKAFATPKAIVAQAAELIEPSAPK